MSAFFIWLEFSGHPIDHNVANAMFKSIAPYGEDAQDLLVNESLAMGVASRWSTPEDIGETQPLYNHAGSQCLLFDGRIDNREHLIDELEVVGPISDGRLLHEFLIRFSDSRLPEVIGPFAFVLFDLAEGTLLAARDTMGGRYLVFKQDDERLMVASTELAFMNHPSIKHKLNEVKVGSWLINHQEDEHSACLKGLSVLNPGQTIYWSNPRGQRATPKSFYHPPPERRIYFENDAEYAREFRRLLDQAVTRRMRSVGAQGVMLSGGMDSVPIAISAGLSSLRVDLKAYSWVFDDTPDMDERRYSEPICKKFEIKQQLIKCDDIWPRFDKDTHLNPLFPFSLPYAEFQQHTFRQARADGVTALLTGLQGDLLYTHGNHQVLSAFFKADFSLALREFGHLKVSLGLSYYSTIKRFVFAPLPFISVILERRRASMSACSEFLSDSILRSLPRKFHWLSTISRRALRPLQYRVAMDGFSGEDAMLGRIMENKYGVERRYPFRDRELCEYMLAIPTDQLVRLGVSRPIVKAAYRNEFTPQLMNRNDKTHFQAGLRHGIESDELYEAFLNQQPKYWRKYVKQRYFSSKSTQTTLKSLVKWQCAYYNFWYRMWYDSSSDEFGGSRGQIPQNRF